MSGCDDDDEEFELDENGELITKKAGKKPSAKTTTQKKKVEDDWKDDDADFENEDDNAKKKKKKAKDRWSDDGYWPETDDQDDTASWRTKEEEEEEEVNEKEKWEIQCENLFFMAESNRKDDPKGALKDFEECIAIEEEKTKEIKYRFKAIKHIIIILYQLKRMQDMIKCYKQLLAYANDVSPNDLNDAIRLILNIVEQKEENNSNNTNALRDMYEITLEYFKHKPGKEHFWFNHAMRLCKTYLEKKDYKECEQLLEELHKSCKVASTGQDDSSKGAELLEIYAVKIQIMIKKNTSHIALTELFEKTSQLFADINDPRYMCVIKECWGKMYASMNQWDDAYSNFFDAFRSYQDIGHDNVRQCLKYVVIASMLSNVGTNPFATQEARVYQQNIDIIPVVTLFDAFENDNITLFEKTLTSNKKKDFG